MHPSRAYRNDDREDALAFIAAHPFALLAANGTDGPVTALAPLVLHPKSGSLIGHVARANPFWRAAEESGARSVAVFRGADAYISPSFYASKAEHGRVVPTWNYMAVEVRGALNTETEADSMRSFLEPLTDMMERHRNVPWQVSDAPDDYISKLSNGIVGVSLSIENITFVRKLSQDKPEQDQQGVIAGLSTENNSAAQAIAGAMRLPEEVHSA